MKKSLKTKISIISCIIGISTFLNGCDSNVGANNPTTNNAKNSSATSVAFNNNSSFYLYLSGSTPNHGCPQIVKPGESSSVLINPGNVWTNSCYYVACSTKEHILDSFASAPQCVEKLPQGTKGGGYLAFIAVNPDPAANSCSIPGYNTGTNTFGCSIDTSGNFNIAFQSKIQTYSAGPNINQPVTLPPIPTPTDYISAPGLLYRGVNIAGLGANGTIADVMNQRPDLPDFRYFAEKGMNTVRLPIRWEYLLADNESGYYNLISGTTLNQSEAHINTMYVEGLKDTISKYLNAGVNVIVDMHTYLRYCQTGSDEAVNVGYNNDPINGQSTNECQIVNTTDFANTWKLLASELQPLALAHGIDKQTQLMFGLVNEPFSENSQKLKTQDLFDTEVAGAKEIRALGLNNRIIFSGNYWDSLNQWTTFVPTDGSAESGDLPNGAVFTEANFTNAGIDVNGIAIEVHQYFDQYNAGRGGQCIDYGSYENFVSFVNGSGLNSMSTWMNNNHMQIMLTEFGGANNQVCQTDLEYMFEYLKTYAYQPGKNNGGFIGWQLFGANRFDNADGYGNNLYLLNQSDYTVYGADGTEMSAIQFGYGILGSAANNLMNTLFYHLEH